ncbi:hypothetical protein PO124_32255 [Bacillus licheniformis]|nr:hypothetical protein [Bacillus licheniformis]
MFRNPHGLDDHPDHYSSAYDMALLTKYAMTNETYKKSPERNAIKQKRCKASGEIKQAFNRALQIQYRREDGIYKACKRTLVSTSSKDGTDLIAVTINAPDDWNDHMNMFNYVFGHYKHISSPKRRDSEIKRLFYGNKAFIKRDVTYLLNEEEKKM